MATEYTGPTGPTGPTGNGIRYSFIDSCNQLVFVYDDGFQSTLGNVLGPTGPTGWTGSTGSLGPTGVGIQLVYLDSFLASQLFPACNDNIAIMWVELHQERIAV